MTTADREALAEALREMVYETTHLSREEPDGSHWCKISAEALGRARAALRAQAPSDVDVERVAACKNCGFLPDSTD